MELDISGARIFFTLPIDVPVLGPLRISETMVVSWIVMILITGLCIWLTHDLKEENISKRQAVAELIVEKANSFVIGNMGEKFRYLIPFVAALFATSVVSNLISLIGLRSPTADLSTEAAWAVVVFIMITAQKIKTSGFACLPKAVRRIYPSPLGPKPTPGVPTTLASYNICSKNRQELMSFGVFSQIYGAFTPPYTSSPDVSSPSFMVRALFI